MKRIKDHFFKKAKSEGYAARSVYKLQELDKKFSLIKKGDMALDLGCAPGSWLQYASKRVGSAGRVVGIDKTLRTIKIPSNATFLNKDALRVAEGELLKEFGLFDVVLSDMAAPTTGHTRTDHIRIMALAEAAAYFACDVLAPGGAFVSKVLQGGTERELLDLLKRSFATVRHLKPPASRSDSAELYVLATGFRGR